MLSSSASVCFYSKKMLKLLVLCSIQNNYEFYLYLHNYLRLNLHRHNSINTDIANVNIK